MDFSNFILAVIGLGLGFLGFGFTAWARKLDQGTAAILRLEKSIREIVELRLEAAFVKMDGVAADVHEIRQDMKGLVDVVHKHETDLAVLNRPKT